MKELALEEKEVELKQNEIKLKKSKLESSTHKRMVDDFENASAAKDLLSSVAGLEGPDAGTNSTGVLEDRSHHGGRRY